MATLTLKLPEKKAKKFYKHLKEEHPKYSRSLKIKK
jgi:hypothetical protein